MMIDNEHENDEVIDTTEQEGEAEAHEESNEPSEEPKPTLRDALTTALEEQKAQEEGQISENDKKPEAKAKEPGDEQSSTAPELKPIDPPRFWSEEKKKEWAKLPRDWQEYLLEQDTKTQKYTGTISQEKAKYERQHKELVSAVDEETRAALQQNQIPETEYFKTLAKADADVRRDPLGAVLKILNGNGKSLQDLVARAQAEEQIPEHVRQAFHERDALAAEKQKYEAQLNEIKINTFVDRIESFAQETDASGNRVRPHMDDPEVQQEVSRLIPLIFQANPDAKEAQILSEAYRRATSYLPHIVEAETQKREQQRIAEERKAVEKARRASMPLSSSGVSATMSAKPSSLREALAQSLKQQREGRI